MSGAVRGRELITPSYSIVMIVSDCLDPEELKEMMLCHAASLQEAIDQVIYEKRPGRIAVLPAAVNLIPQVAPC